MLWTEEHVAELKQRWPNENARQIGAAIGMTRNAVLGKIHRLGLSERVNRKPVHRVEHADKGRRRNGGAVKAAIAAKRAREQKIAARGNQSPLTNVMLARAMARGELPACEAVDLPQEQITHATVALLDLEHRHCRWPIEYDGATMYCGAEKHIGAYCARHAAMAYRPIKERKVTGREMYFLRAMRAWKAMKRAGAGSRKGWRA